MPIALAQTPPGPLHRVGRAPDPLAWPEWQFVGGGRFDDPNHQFRVLYLAESRVACFVELLAGFRLDLDLLAQTSRVTGAATALPQPVISADWYRRRRIG